MAELLFGAVLVLLLLRVLSNGEPVELDDLLGIPQLIALALVSILFVVVFTRDDGAAPVRVMAGIAAAGLMTILFPERMPDTLRGGTLMTAFWSLFGWLMIGLAYAVVLIV